MVEAAYETPNPIYTVASDAPSYYNAATGQTGATLKASLKTIINTGVIKRSYGDSRYADSMLDQDPNNPQNVLEIYNRGSVPGTWDSTSANWTREHQWPTSLLPSGAPSSNTTKSQATDLFELRPINQSINSSRGNSAYGLPNSTGGTYNSTPQPFGLDPTQVYWYPGAADTGDVARTLFYMATMYGDSTSPNNLTLVNGDTNTVGQMGDLASLLKWNYTDPVDNFERRRNHLIYTSDAGVNGWNTAGRAAPFNVAPYNQVYNQGNRNPYIDHPEYVWSIFGGGNNDSQIHAGANVNADGSSATTINLRVMKNGTWGSGGVTLSKIGTDPTTYDLTGTSNVVTPANTLGPGQAFDYGSQTRTVSASLSDSTSTTGLKTGTIALDNTDLTTSNSTNTGSADGNDVITVSGQVVDNRVIAATPVAFGRVIFGAVVSGNTTVSSAGDDNHNTRVTVLGTASSTDGNGAFIAAGANTTYNGTTTTGTRTVQANFASPGSKSNSLAFAVQGEGLTGETVNGVSVSYTATALDHSQPSLASGSSSTAQTIDFGYVPTGFTPRTAGFSVFNNASGFGVANTASLDVDGVTSTGSAGMSTNVVASNPASPLAPGSAWSYTATFTPDTVAGAASADHTIAVSDEDIPGSANRPSLVVTTTGRTLTAAMFPVSGFINLLNGETYNTGAFSIAAGVTLTKNGPGTMNITGAQNNGANSALAANAGIVNFNTDAGAAGNAPLALSAGGGTVNLTTTQHLESITATAGAVQVANGGSNVVVADSVSVSGSGKIDLTNNKMIVRTQNVAAMTPEIAAGRNNGTWDGAGIVTSMTAALGSHSLTTLGVASASDVLQIGGASTGTWNGETVDGTDTLIKYTYAGDANLDGRINADDYFQIDSNYAGGASTYFDGDFNYDGIVNGDDYFLIDQNFQSQTDTLAAPLTGVSAVPEPAGFVLLVGVAALLRRRRR